MLIHNGLIIMVIIGNNNNYCQGNIFMSPREIIHIQQASVWKYRQNFYQTLWLLLFTHSKKISDIVCNDNHTKIWKHCLEQGKRSKTMWENWSLNEISTPNICCKCRSFSTEQWKCHFISQEFTIKRKRLFFFLIFFF